MITCLNPFLGWDSMEKSEVLEKLEECRSYVGDLYDQCEEDWRFLHGEGQWEAKAEKARQKDGRPCLVLNQLLPYAQQVVNDIRQAKMGIRVSPVDEAADIDTADVLQGIIRNIERQSNFSQITSTAALNAVGAGLGWIKIKTDYADNMTFDQEIYIDRVLDFTSVYTWGDDSIDGSGNEGAIVLDSYSEDLFKETWPDAECVSFEECNEDEVIVAEVYYKEYEDDKLYRISLIDGSEKVLNQELINKLDENEVIYEVLAERDIQIPTVKKCIYAGDEEPLEETDFPSQYIPVVPVIGEEVFINGQREFHSLIRQAKDAQKMYNYHKSASAEILALQPKAPWIAPKGSFKSYPNKWSTANRVNHSALEYDIVYDKDGRPMPPPQRQQAPVGSPASMQEAMAAREDIRLAIGMPQSNMGEAAGEVSGIAIRNRQIEGDNATFHFVDNLAASISQVGRILVDMVPRVYSTKKIARIIGEDGTEKNIPINQPFIKEEGEIRLPKKGEQATGIYNLGVGKYDVVCDVGASYSSKRQETADKLIELVRAKPELADITADLLFEALDLPMGKEIAERLRANMDPALLEEDPQAAKLKKASEALKVMEDQLLNYQAALDDKSKNQEFEEHVKLKELNQEQLRIMNEIRKTTADIEKIKAETQGIDVEALNALGGAVGGIASQVEDLTAAMNTIMDAKESEMEEATSEPINTEEPQD